MEEKKLRIELDNRECLCLLLMLSQVADHDNDALSQEMTSHAAMVLYCKVFKSFISQGGSVL